MICIFVPFYNKNTDCFTDSLLSQGEPFRLITRDTKKDKILWTEAANSFYEYVKYSVPDNDIVGIMNNDIAFPDDYFLEASLIKQGEVAMPKNCTLTLDWGKKKFYEGSRVDAFIGRCFFMRAGDFKASGGFCKYMPHYLSDIEFSSRIIRKGMKLKLLPPVVHEEHIKPKVNVFSFLSYKNPFVWTLFLFRAGWNKYILINLIKVWLGILLKK